MHVLPLHFLCCSLKHIYEIDLSFLPFGLGAGVSFTASNLGILSPQNVFFPPTYISLESGLVGNFVKK